MPRSVECHLAVVAVLLFPAISAAQVVVGQIDTFQDGTTDSWRQGAQATAPYAPVNIPTGGPAGAGDKFMQFGSRGGTGANSLLTALNTVQWGNSSGVTYGPSVTGMAVDVENLGGTPLTIRFGFRDTNSNEYSTAGFSLAADATWHHALFSLLNANMTQVQGTSQPFDVALATGILQARILSAVSPAFDGDSIVATLGVDNITATGAAVPEPGSLGLVFAAVGAGLARMRVWRSIQERIRS